ncbi:hypothetical protein [Stenotrophomonas sp. Marseille-Q4652]|uniref:hypothetical protein n=1 Tax=Stenotrophomonas sp. Marseille-Q4652 TaxID=2866595 RepID=UPI001CE3DCC0|nr:hypothetical protein [Stenotrophomonas sp. Marseille-Q4652]
MNQHEPRNNPDPARNDPDTLPDPRPDNHGGIDPDGPAPDGGINPEIGEIDPARDDDADDDSLPGKVGGGLMGG